MRRLYPALAAGLFITACAEVPTGPRLDSGDLGPVLALSAASGTVTYDFRVLPEDCGGPFTTPIEGLTFVEPVLFTVCDLGDGSALLVYDPDAFTPVTNTIELDAAATSVTVEAWWLGTEFNPVITAYDADGIVVATAVWTSSANPDEVTLEGSGITSITITSQSLDFAVYSLTVTYGSSDPTVRDACFKGGWEAFGFRNQGQCVRFVETGKDSR